MDKLAYKNAVNKVFMSLVIYVVVSILSTIMATFVATSATVDLTAAIISGTSWPIGALLTVLICPLLSVAAYIYYYMCLGGLANAVHENDVPAVKKLRSAALLSLIGTLIGMCIFLVILSGSLTFIGVMSVVILLASLVLAIISYIFTLIGYSKLKNSETFPGKDGAKLLFVASILALCGSVVAAIPFIGVVGGLASLVALVLMIVGWLKIKNSEVAE